MRPLTAIRRVTDRGTLGTLRRLVAVGATLLSAACTYAPPEVRVRTRNVAVSPDGEFLAAMVEYERFRRPTGLAAFPDGGVTKKLEQRADLYVVALGPRSMVFEGSVPVPRDRLGAAGPWLTGWTADHRVFFRATGPTGSSLHAYRVGGAITEAVTAEGAVLEARIIGPSTYLSAGTEPYGVSVSRQAGAQREPLLTFVGDRLVVVPRPDGDH
jgi:hypothetical protein